jgi:hypothetical protein
VLLWRRRLGPWILDKRRPAMEDEIYKISRINPSDDHLKINEESLMNRQKKKQHGRKDEFKKVLEEKEHERENNSKNQKSKDSK